MVPNSETNIQFKVAPAAENWFPRSLMSIKFTDEVLVKLVGGSYKAVNAAGVIKRREVAPQRRKDYRYSNISVAARRRCGLRPVAPLLVTNC